MVHAILLCHFSKNKNRTQNQKNEDKELCNCGKSHISNSEYRSLHFGHIPHTESDNIQSKMYIEVDT